MRCAMTRVFPEPAPARMRSGPSIWRTASRCSGFKPCSGSNEFELHKILGTQGNSTQRRKDAEKEYSRLEDSADSSSLLFYRDALREVPRLVHIAAAAHRD